MDSLLSPSWREFVDEFEKPISKGEGLHILKV